MRTDENITLNLAQSADIINTINGGTVYPTFTHTREEDHYRLEVSIPSIDPDNIKVEINAGHLLVLQNMELNEIELPNLLGMQEISPEVSHKHITASYEEELLVVIMPFSELTGDSRREIDILKY